MAPAAATDTDHAEQVRDKATEKYGFVPNFIGEATDETPAVAEVYLNANAAINDGVLSDAEREAVRLSISAQNDCHCRTTAHAAGVFLFPMPRSFRSRCFVQRRRVEACRGGGVSVWSETHGGGGERLIRVEVGEAIHLLQQRMLPHLEAVCD